MGAEECLYRMDPRKIEVVSGDIKTGFWELRACVLKRCPELLKSSETKDSDSESNQINLDRSIAKIEIRSIKDANPTGNLLGVGVGALAGLRFFGPIGAVAGAVAGQVLVGNRHEVQVEIQLQDGRHFVAKLDKSVFERIKVIADREFSKSQG